MVLGVMLRVIHKAGSPSGDLYSHANNCTNLFRRLSNVSWSLQQSLAMSLTKYLLCCSYLCTQTRSYHSYGGDSEGLQLRHWARLGILLVSPYSTFWTLHRNDHSLLKLKSHTIRSSGQNRHQKGSSVHTSGSVRTAVIYWDPLLEQEINTSLHTLRREMDYEHKWVCWGHPVTKSTFCHSFYTQLTCIFVSTEALEYIQRPTI